MKSMLRQESWNWDEKLRPQENEEGGVQGEGRRENLPLEILTRTAPVENRWGPKGLLRRGLVVEKGGGRFTWTHVVLGAGARIIDGGYKG